MIQLVLYQSRICLKVPHPCSLEMAVGKQLFYLQFSSVHSTRSVVSDSLRPHRLQHARPPWPSPTPGVYSNSCPLSRWCHPTISSSVVLSSLLPQLLEMWEGDHAHFPYSCPQFQSLMEPWRWDLLPVHIPTSAVPLTRSLELNLLLIESSLQSRFRPFRASSVQP